MCYGYRPGLELMRPEAPLCLVGNYYVEVGTHKYSLSFGLSSTGDLKWTKVM